MFAWITLTTGILVMFALGTVEKALLENPSYQVIGRHVLTALLERLK